MGKVLMVFLSLTLLSVLSHATVIERRKQRDEDDDPLSAFSVISNQAHPLHANKMIKEIAADPTLRQRLERMQQAVPRHNVRPKSYLAAVSDADERLGASEFGTHTAAL